MLALIVKDSHRFGQPVHLLSGQEAESERRFSWLGGSASTFSARLDLANASRAWSRKTLPAAVSSITAYAADHELSADLVLQILHLAA